MTKPNPRSLGKLLTLTPALRRQAAEFLLSRGFLSYGKEENKVRAIAILLREGGTFNARSLAGTHSILAQTVPKSLEVLVSVGAVALVTDRTFRLNLASPVAANYYAAGIARYFRVAALDERKPPSRRGAAAPPVPMKYRVLRTWEDLGGRPSVSFATDDGEEGEARVESVLAGEAFRTFAKLRREVPA